MKKIGKILSLLCSMVIFTGGGSIITLSACSDVDDQSGVVDTSGVVEHTHTYEDYYYYNNNHHWRAASCGHDEVSDFGEHEWNDGVIISYPTTTQTGSEIYTCTTCGTTKIESISKLEETPHTHTFANTYVYNQTYHWKESICGDTEVSNYGEHEWDDGVIISYPTTTQTGSEIYTCTTCGTTKIESISKLEETPHTHTFANTYVYNQTYHWKESICGDTEVSNYGEHEWDDGVIITHATFTQTGSKVYTCEICGSSKNETIPVLDVKDENNYSYRLSSDGTYIVTGSLYSELRDIVIPSTYKGKTVSAIDDYAFYATDIISVDIPESVTKIGSYAFANCVNLYNVSIAGESKTVILFNDLYTSLNGLTVGKNAFTNTTFTSIQIDDSNDGDTKVSVSISNKNSNIKSIKVISALNSSTDITFENLIKMRSATTYSGTLDFGTYGLFNNIIINAYDASGKVIATIYGSDVAVTAEHYNLALLNGTFPVMLFTLSLDSITKAGPTFVGLERTAAYDWTQLPENVQCFPFTTKNDATVNTGFHHLRSGLQSYIKQLYELDNDSTFTLYAVDNYPELILQMLVANNIPETNWNAVLLSDGTGTAGALNRTYAVDNADEVYNEMVQNWNYLKEYVSKNGYNRQTIVSEIKYLGNYGEYQALENYAYVIAKQQSNVEWWVNRLRTGENLSAVTAKSETLATDIVKTAKSVSIATLLGKLTAEQGVALKALYHFSDEMFSEAQTQNKKVMIILGTSASNEGVISSDGANFYNYLRMTMEFYGDDYVYYYKGHPGYPTSLYSGRQAAIAQLAKDGFVLNELDNSIAAELILFYNPDVYISGWASTTFESVQSQSMACTLYDVSYENKGQYNLYSDMIDSFITKLAAETTDYKGISLDSTHTYYLIQYNNTAEYSNQMANYNKHEIAIYDANEKTITYYYKGEGASYTIVDIDGKSIDV